MRSFFYKPEDAWAGDFIPFYAEGAFQLFYLHDWRNQQKYGEGTPWYRVSTNDFVHFTEHGEVIPRGSKQEQDLYAFTGCAIQAAGQYHIFYTGHNPHFLKSGRNQEAVMHAVSDDLKHWRKLPQDTFYADPRWYEAHDWRDPFVFWNKEAGEYWMLLAARRNKGASHLRRGCTALCTSPDLNRWEVREPFWSPGLYDTHECPDLFRMGDWWYLIYSEYSDRMITRYRMSQSLSGPWLAPSVDTFDDSYYYAAKTASDGQKRYLFGWNATRKGCKDFNEGEWGGNLAVHEVIQNPDGTLSVRLPQSVREHFQPDSKDFAFFKHVGASNIQPDAVEVYANDTFACALVGDPMPDPCLIEATLSFQPGTRRCGFMLRASENNPEKAYYVSLNPLENRLVLDAWWGRFKPRFIILERPINLTAGQPIRLQVLVSQTLCEVYVNDQVALSTRFYDLPAGLWGVFAEGSLVRFEHIRLGIPR